MQMKYLSSIKHFYKKAIIRLSCRTLSVEIDKLSKQNLEQQATNEIFENLIAMKDDISECKSDIERLKKMENSHIPYNVRQTHLEQLKQWGHDDKIYYDKTRFYEATQTLLQSCSVVGLVGGPGCGKTATVKHIALTYEQDGYEVIPVVDFDKIVMYGDSKLKQIFVIDDILGVFSVNMNWYNNLNSHKEGIIQVIGKESKLLFTCRKSVYNEAVKLKSFILKNVIDLESKEHILNDEEKKSLLANHCRYLGVPEYMYSNLSLSSSFIMFPLLCKIFSTTYKKHVSVDKFFAGPFACLCDEFDKMEQITPKYYASLVMCVLSNNLLSVNEITIEKDMKLAVFDTCGVNIGTSAKEIQNAVSHLVGTYLIQNQNYFTFVHDAIYEIVAYHYGKTYPQTILKYMNSSFIATKVTVDKDQHTDAVSTNLSIVIDEDCYQQLAERLYASIQSFEVFDVFKNKSLHYKPFLKTFIKLLREKPYTELTKLICHEQTSSKLINICSSNYRKADIKTDSYEEQKRQELLKNVYHVVKVQIFPRIISWIIYYGHTYLLNSIVSLVLEHNDSTDIVFGSEITEQTRLLTLGCHSGEDDMVNLILKYVNIVCINRTSLDKTLNYDEPEIEKIWNMHRTRTPLISACASGNLSIVKILLRNKANIDQVDDLYCFALLAASEQGHNDVVEYLVQKGGNFNQCDENNNNMTCLHVASYNGHSTVVKYLVQQGADVNQCDEDDKSPLYRACEGGHTAIVEFLVYKGADVNRCSTHNKSPLYKACKQGHYDVAKFLLANGANVNQFERDNKSPLYIACKNGQKDVAKYLLENGADVNQCERDNKSPLYIACKKGHNDVAKYLLENGADVNQCDTDTKSLLYKACDGGHTTIV